MCAAGLRGSTRWSWRAVAAELCCASGDRAKFSHSLHAHETLKIQDPHRHQTFVFTHTFPRRPNLIVQHRGYNSGTVGSNRRRGGDRKDVETREGIALRGSALTLEPTTV
jgi:hypothetical protein